MANTLDIVGDKWSLLIIRDMRHGKRTYGELADSPERIPTNILADRLRRLEDAGIVARSAYQERPPRYAYTLTDKGKDLGAGQGQGADPHAVHAQREEAQRDRAYEQARHARRS